jgi:hypothetical protein
MYNFKRGLYAVEGDGANTGLVVFVLLISNNWFKNIPNFSGVVTKRYVVHFLKLSVNWYR